MANPSLEVRDPFYNCRIGGDRHQWSSGVALPPHAKTEVVRDCIHKTCLQCGSDKYIPVDIYGRKNGSEWIEHVPGYLIPMDQRATPDEIRKHIKKQQDARRRSSKPAAKKAS